MTSANLDGVGFYVSKFPTAMPKTVALGTMESMTWSCFTALLADRREGIKDGENVVLARFTPEPDGQVRRLLANAVARTAVALDCETNKKTGEIPPALATVVKAVEGLGWAGAFYTSHNHSVAAPRYRIVLPITNEIDPALPAPEVIAKALGLDGVLDTSKLNAASVFYLPSCEPGALQRHDMAVIKGAPICATWLTDNANALLAEREIAQAAIRAEALAAAEGRRAARAAAGFKPTENLIAAIRDRLELAGELLKHGYTKKGNRFLYSGSETGIPGVHILDSSDGVERAYSHHSGDPLAAGNLPSWCTKAIDVVDVVTILDFNGDQRRALRHLAKQFGIEGKREAETPEEPAGFMDGAPGEADTIGAAFDRVDAGKAKIYGAPTWHEPVDFLAAENSAAPTLEARHIPDALWPFVADTAARMGVDPTAVALCALVSCASVISDDWAVQPKRFDTTWTENARIWGAIVGDPSIMKTPVISAATRPIDKLEADARERHKLDMRKWREDENQAKQDKSVPPPQPKLDRFMIEGTTVEAISEVLRDDDEAKAHAPCKKLLSRHDEMSEFFGSLDKYKAGAKGGSDRGSYLRLYNGGRYTVDRIQRGSFSIPNWSACFLGGVQPGPIQRIAKDAADDGLLQRFLYCVPDAQRQGIDRQPDYSAAERYAALFPALVAFHPGTAIGSDYIRPLAFHEDAHQHREHVDALAQSLSVMPDCSSRLKASFGKWPGLFARLCLTFHIIEQADYRARGEAAPYTQVIRESTARQVASFMRQIVMPHLMRAEALMFSTDQSKHARWIAGYILAKKLDAITTRHIMRDYRPLEAPETRRDLNAVMASLVAVGWLEPEEPANLSKGVTSWKVNPQVHTLFAERACAEADRRGEARAKIAESVAKVRQDRVGQAAE